MKLIRYLQSLAWSQWIPLALIGAFCATAVTAYFFPIYVDEIVVRYSLSRLIYDFPFRSSGFPTCLSSYATPIPWTMYLPAFINWAIHGMVPNVLVLRLVGFIIAFPWIGGLAVYLSRKIKKSTDSGDPAPALQHTKLYAIGWVLALFSIGVFPFFLILNRSEQLMLPSIIALIAISIISERPSFKNHPKEKIGAIGVYFVAVSLILFNHSKGLFLTPLFLIVGWQLFRNHKTPLLYLAAMGLVGLQAAHAYFFIQQSMQCDESPQFLARLQACGLDVKLLFHDPTQFFKQVYASISDFPKYLTQLGFQEHTDFSHLPAIPLGPAEKLANLFIKLNVAIAFFALLFFVPFGYYRQDVSSGHFITVNAALTALLAGMLCSAFFVLHRSWYAAAYLYALLLIIMIFFVGENHVAIFRKIFTRGTFYYLAAVALLSQALLIGRYLPPFLEGYARYPGVSIAKYDSRKNHDDIAEAAEACGIDPVTSRHVAVDEYTYLFFRRTKLPLSLTSIGTGLSENFLSLRAFFSIVDSDGMVIRCIPPLLRYADVVKNRGEICCISKRDLKKM